jgi:NAD(P)-dependent dehydrogenase (short-subunit alcohol dehydrogenase family)
MTVDLSGKVAVITGAGGAIGTAMAAAFARNGAKVVCAGRTLSTLEATVKAIQESGGEACAVIADVAKKESAAGLIAETVKKYGRLDCLVNNAGINGGAEERKRIHEYSDDLWDRIISTDLNGVYYCSKPAVAYMIEHGGGSIINVSSIVGVMPLRLQCAFAAAKAGVVNLSKAMAIELAEDNIRVNVLCPGSILFEGTKKIFYDDKDKAEAILKAIPMHRPGTPEEMTGITCFLASDDASYITGGVFVADGGWTCNIRSF